MNNKSSIATDSRGGFQLSESSDVIFELIKSDYINSINEFNNPILQELTENSKVNHAKLKEIDKETTLLKNNSQNLNKAFDDAKEDLEHDFQKNNPNLTPQQIQARFQDGVYVEVDANGFEFVNPEHPYNKALKAKKEAEKKQEELEIQEQDLLTKIAKIETEAINEIDDMKKQLEDRYRDVFPDYDNLKNEFDFGSSTIKDKDGNEVSGVITITPKDEINTERKDKLEIELKEQKEALEEKIKTDKATDSEKKQFEALEKAINQIVENREKFNKYEENKKNLTEAQFKQLPLEEQVNPNKDVRVSEFKYKDNETGKEKSFKMLINEDPVPDKDGHTKKTTQFYEDGKLVSLGDLAKGNDLDRAKLKTYTETVENTPPCNSPNIKKVYFIDEGCPPITKEKGVTINLDHIEQTQTITVNLAQENPVDIAEQLKQQKTNPNLNPNQSYSISQENLGKLDEVLAKKGIGSNPPPSQTQDDSQLTSTKVEESSKYSDIIKGLDLSAFKQQSNKQQKEVEPQERKQSVVQTR